MKKLILLLGSLLLSVTTFAQYNPDIVPTKTSQPVERREFILPKVNGLTLYKADLHLHTIYSDAETTPEYRCKEAWIDGLDIIAITDHIEYRRHEPHFLEFLAGYGKKKAVNHNVIRKPANEKGIKADLNYSVARAQKEAPKYNILVIPGAEITREPVEIGHYNALFTVDNNKLYTADPLEALRKAKEQGALVQHNHPGWRRTSCDKTEFEVKAYNEGLIDGVEVANGGQFYPKIISRAMDENLYVASNTDMHNTSHNDYICRGVNRNMTFILSDECTLEKIKEALVKHQTIAYTGGELIASEDLLVALFNASVQFNVIATDSKGKRTIALYNPTSLEFTIQTSAKAKQLTLRPFQTMTMTVDKGKKLSFNVVNMWSREDKHPRITLEL